MSDWTPDIFRDLWVTDVRLRIAGHDVTYFRGVPAQIGGYQLQEPYAFGPGDFAFPQITQFEVDKFGDTGSLSWLYHGARVELRPVEEGSYGTRLWAGILTSINVTEAGVAIHCDGDLSGRLALRDKAPPVFSFKKDTGVMVYDSLIYCGVDMLPFLGPETGLLRFTIGGGSDYLSDVNELLASAMTDDGEQWTIGRQATGSRYEMRLKDTTTTHATVFLGAYGVELDMTRDMTEEPTSIYGTGVDPNGQKITNAVIPNLFTGEPATYPFADHRTFGIGTTNEETDSGAGLNVLTNKLHGEGLLDREAGGAVVYDRDISDAVKALQRRAGLPITGTVNVATWNALFNVTAAGRTLYQARVLPMAQLTDVQRYFLTSNGSLDLANPNFDPLRIPVDRTIDHGGGVWKSEMLKYSGKLLDQVTAQKNWVGTLALTGADVFAGNVTSSTPDPTPMSRLALREGMNIKIAHFDSGTRFHISGINVDGDRNVKLALDTRSRDLLTIGQIIARNKESRRHPAREFINSVRRPNALNTLVTSNELFGLIDDWPLKGDQWNQVIVPCGQSGTIDRVRVHLRDDKAAFVMGVTVQNISPGQMDNIAGSNPLTPTTPASDAKVAQRAVTDDPATPDDETQAATPAVAAVAYNAGSKWIKGHVQHVLKSTYLFLYTAGQGDQPLGYYPRAHRGDDNKITDAPITGNWEDDAGFAFRTFHDDKVAGVLYVLIYPDRDCTLQAGKMLYVNQTEGS